jgi:hypothetical protein
MHITNPRLVAPFPADAPPHRCLHSTYVRTGDDSAAALICSAAEDPLLDPPVDVAGVSVYHKCCFFYTQPFLHAATS